MKGSEQVSANSEQVTASRRMGNVVVLPKVWAVGEKKPCGSVGVAGGAWSGRANAGISPLRRFAPPVEMTVHREGSGALVQVPSAGGGLCGRDRKADPSPSAQDDRGVAAQDDKKWGARSGGAVEVAFYRKYTEAMLRRYAVMSLEGGRVPSMLGREMFRGKVTSYKVHGFDDVVNFCLDVESCLRRLSGEDQLLIKRVAVQQYTHGEAALMLGVCMRTCITRYGEALDRLTKVFLSVKLLEPQNACQEARRPLLRVSGSN